MFDLEWKGTDRGCSVTEDGVTDVMTVSEYDAKYGNRNNSDAPCVSIPSKMSEN